MNRHHDPHDPTLGETFRKGDRVTTDNGTETGTVVCDYEDGDVLVRWDNGQTRVIGVDRLVPLGGW